MKYRPAEQRFFEKVNKSGPTPPERPDLGPCWLWTASLDRKGYGKFNAGPESTSLAHRWCYIHLVGPVEAVLTLDHLCRNRSCVNPAHLEPVTSTENTLRGFGPTAVNAAKTQCIHGHPLSGANLRVTKRGTRQCRMCRNDRPRVSPVEVVAEGTPE